MRTRVMLAALAVPLALLTACSGDSDETATDPAATSGSPSPSSDPTDTPSPTESSSSAAPAGPSCDDVWQAGAKVPKRYQGCFNGTKMVPVDSRYCEFGKPLITYEGRFYGVPGGTVLQAERSFAKDAGYQDALLKCSG